MSSQEKSFERINQKQRTRGELLRAARALSEKGGQPTVAEAADHAGISRATAYRYFSNPDDMMREALLDAVASGISMDITGGALELNTAEERVAEVIKQVAAMVASNEPMFRSFLASSATGKSPVKRGGRRIAWLTEALQPLEGELTKSQMRNLMAALSLLTGIETFIVFKDICGMNNKQIEETALWTAKVLLAGVRASS
ncbi:TetR/AcrR family transcriptional regulator [Rhizobium sp. C4]|uniref:TetR/AcrR family transcriptional regulator n=1 Tax=Rhizobium sp. C4 TaxID=1349800 RepID=UPI001E5F95A9|nr:TetR/AcrR family transcriptional regulator [Rhizobium sp. C4]MCD2173219.1 TetR/AcrR family transcriptional regulator [Rhizobium sp. C4]